MGHTLADLMSKFASASDSDHDSATGAPPARKPAATGGDHTKLASGGEPMHSLASIYLTLTDQDHVKQAAARAPAPAQTEDDVDFAAMAEKIAEAEATEEVEAEDDGSIVKVAQEYDAAGRIMARGFFDEFYKLAEGIATTAPDNQMTESESTAKTPALGERGLPTLETNFAGTANHDERMTTSGTAPKTNYADSLAPTKTISAGQGTGTDPEAAAIGLGGGSPLGFATVRDLQG
ncbi:MAG: hypothetical protein KBF21_19160 [Thermoanaerobaculia bacterium]|nr:hypothetical protein [Thermoanaerobaculia bacterium]